MGQRAKSLCWFGAKLRPFRHHPKQALEWYRPPTSRRYSAIGVAAIALRSICCSRSSTQSSAGRPRASFGRERADHTLQPTALVHEVYLRLVDQRQVDWQNRAHFFGVAAEVMRRILVDHARRHDAIKRGDGQRCVSIDEAKDVAASDEIPILALDHALGRLEQVDAALARIVELRAFGGLTIEAAAHVLGVSPSTVKRDWRTARAWLRRELAPEARL